MHSAGVMELLAEWAGDHRVVEMNSSQAWGNICYLYDVSLSLVYVSRQNTGAVLG